MNVLFEAERPPGIIDVSPYWRPASYADGIILADALCWHGLDRAALEELNVPVAAIARGLLFRVLTTQERINDGVGMDFLKDEIARYEKAASAIGL
ncbi:MULTISPECIES: hypothetical protein [Arthrobacter]|uniref:Uncharacterized protein n=1 Tax=Arthrobacter terricola TaxID=2547396 RepID=A0A4R5KCI7_9MICC|nr:MULTISPECIES: hypothetical protein [Arthrobacter]MBT8163014.1 hypothetical protein [Arthrobacter sp. GN70]TDF91780.1 hypothetical protein E1809_19880 [Arthrobacter terricola]